MRLQMFCVVSVSSLLIGCASNSYEARPFFQHEYAAESHGQKTILDRIVETDPGSFKVETSPQYLKDPPERIAVLPFADIGSANFVVDKIALTHRSKIERANWAWTDAQRFRRSLDGYLAQREFIVTPMDAVDAVLRARGINTPAELYQTPSEELGRLLGVDAIVYGTVMHYEAYYLLLVAGWQVSVEVSMVSIHGGENLVIATGSRYAIEVMPALSVQDIVINSAENVFSFGTSFWRGPKKRRVAKLCIASPFRRNSKTVLNNAHSTAPKKLIRSLRQTLCPCPSRRNPELLI